ncbi:MAG TPA: M28 family peptidase [Blastocatellia bacterium]|nr:M28 family peptidase [Blastocatellia bacterium]
MRFDLKAARLGTRRSRFVRSVVVLGIAACCLSAQQPAQPFTITPDIEAALAGISADSLRGHLSFIASDALEGRNTPSPGLDIAAEYIAAQFRRAKLEPAGDQDYFQTANFVVSETPMDAFELKLKSGPETISVAKTQVSFNIDRELRVSAPLFKIDYSDQAAVALLKPEELEGKAVLTEITDPRRAEESRRFATYQAGEQFLRKMTELKAALVISIDRSSTTGSGGGQGRLIDPENRRPSPLSGRIPQITVHDPKVVKVHDNSKAGLTNAQLSLGVAAPAERPVRLRNVIGILRGSDPVLKDTYVLVTAHYDHVGVRREMPGDNIFNGANDDGSGTVSVIEIASALASLKQRPKRSIVFMTFFGEEKGLLGSRYYGRHPVFPISNTVADVNLEQVGRTDSSEGPQIANATLTGFDYSDMGPIFKGAGEKTGITVYKHEQNSDSFFARSDNQALADQGVPAHTLCTAFVYPDYHGAGDHWEKIDYANMAKVDRMVALALTMIANNPESPRWNESNPKTSRYIKAWADHHGK